MCPERVTASLCTQIPTQVMRGVWRSQDWTPVPRPWGPAQPLPTGPSARRPLREPSLPVLSPASSASITDLGNSFLSLIRLCCLPPAPRPSPQERGDPGMEEAPLRERDRRRLPVLAGISQGCSDTN